MPGYLPCPALPYLCLCRDQLCLGCQCRVVQLVLLVLQGPELLLTLLQAILLRGTQLLQLLGLTGDRRGGGGYNRV
jgi:hypothetical protein